MSYLPTSRRRRESLAHKGTVDGKNDGFETISMHTPPKARSRLVRLVGLLAAALCGLYYLYPSSSRAGSSQLASYGAEDTTRCSAPADPSKPLVQYVLMIDAGSTGSRIHVYKFNNCGKVPELEKEAAFKMIQGGLSDYGKKDDWQGAANSLNVLMDLAVATVPAGLQSCSPVALKATAGLRLLGPEKSNKILATVRAHLETKYPFPVVKKDGVIIMDGKDEGVYAWITTNYLLGNIGSAEKKPTAAIFDLGGGSTQIVFEPQFEINAEMSEGEHKYKLSYAGRDFILYQQSHLGYGLMEARKSIHKEVIKNVNNYDEPIPNPCIPPGVTKKLAMEIDGKERQVTMVGPNQNGAAKCRHLAETILNKEGLCDSSPCSFNGIYQPPLAKTFENGEAFIFSYFYDRLTPLGIPSSFSLAEVNALTEKVCAGPDSWSSHFSAIDGAMDELLDRAEYCLDLSFITALLHHGYEMPLERRLRTAKKLQNNELGWCLGASLPLLDAGASGWECRLQEI
ncbi:Nucleoside diphosphatase Gda1 [Taphrina deformans PYCC 5710]|uniref:guanosine-diphosphatase n=1 Tax=Taphrina deformans (strain PYCC 5710 / ATCC 11124 / CBS 356.35 / IMI 108563 / JCM 9778 / NBRC 8474) TaxID=1097556 RepID=R4X8V2_TAPDE|nr:Nucleoside diphosphatase Gda1 [Taphrina deformans PYCC 5710]|eukprot:CCG82068.1 Nucleoside diphosphatase Gda1 [Taphrina deformans PYCC 5710]